LPNLFANSQPRMSLANACNAVMLQTSSNGGYVTLATMSDPSQALSEQFCVARTYAMAQGEDLMGQITGLTQAQIAEQCASFSAMLSGEIDRVSLIENGALTTEMQGFAIETGIAPSDLAATSRVCLAVGYAQDDMRMAVGSALMLVALGRACLWRASGPPPAARASARHAPRPRVGMVRGLDLGAGAGGDPAFMPGQPERTALLRAATLQMGGCRGAVCAAAGGDAADLHGRSVNHPADERRGRARTDPPLSRFGAVDRAAVIFARAPLFTRSVASAKDRATT
jgi:hypothetical protein